MPTFYIPPTNNTNEGTFLFNIVSDIIDLITWVPGQYFGREYVSPFIYPAAASNEDDIKLTSKGIALLFYYKIKNETYPSDPNEEQLNLMKLIWKSMGQPENTVPV
jgi:hypothetical protein